jgi:hypothetical protein
MLRCTSSLVIAAYGKVRLIPQDSRALPAVFLRSRPIFATCKTFYEVAISGIHPLRIPARRPSNNRVGRKLIRSRREKTNDLSSLPDRPLRVHSFPGFLLYGYVKSPDAALSFLLPLDKLGAGLFPVTVSHVMVSLSNHARALPLEIFKEAAPELWRLRLFTRTSSWDLFDSGPIFRYVWVTR